MPIASLRRFMPVAVLACALAAPLLAQGDSNSNQGVTDAEKRVAEEADRLEKKKAACSVEFGNLIRPSVQKELAGDAAAAVLKHKDTIRTQVAEAKAMAQGGKRARTSAETALADDVRTAFENRVGRNLASAPVCDIFIDNVLDGINGGTAFKVEECLSNAIEEVFTGTDFAKNWDTALAETFGKKLKEAKTALDAAKRQAADAAEAEKVAAAGGIPGMILVPEGEHVIGLELADFLLAVIGEELGLIGVIATILGFLWITRRAFQIGRQAIAMERFYAGLVAKGVALWIGSQAFINMGVNLGLLPTKGLTLPLMSYGGTGILVNCVAIGILLRIDRENRITMRGGKL